MKINDTLLKKEELAVFRLRELYEKYGYAQYKMSKFEEYDLYVRNKNFLISDSVITFTDTNGKLMALKPDVTLSIVKNSKDSTDTTEKVYYDEKVYRISEGSHSYREIQQVGLECLGAVDTYCIAEVLSLATESLSLISEAYILDVSHLGILSYILEQFNLSSGGRKRLLNAIEQKSLHDTEAICREEGVPPEKAALLLNLQKCGGKPAVALEGLRALLPDSEWQKTVQQFSEILSLLPQENIRVDFSVINDLSYYNGIVFQGFIPHIPTRILSGGQYDNLLRRMRKNAGAVGFAVYLDRLEGLYTALPAFDIDTVILYKEGDDTAGLFAAVRAIAAEGKSVTAQKSIPEKLKYRQLLQFSESGVSVLENNA